jgi:hypothetical protein
MPSPPLYDTVQQGQCQLRNTVLPTLVRPARRTLERGRRTLKGGMNACLTPAQVDAVTSDQ